MSRRFLIYFVLATLALVANVFVFYRTVHALLQSSNAVEQSLTALATLKDMEAAVAMLESKERRYIITSDRKLLDEAVAGVNAIRTEIDSLERVAAGDAERTRRAAQLRTLIDREAALAERYLALHDSEGASAVIRARKTEAATGGTATFLQILADANDAEDKLLVTRTAQSRDHAKLAVGTFAVAAALDVALLAAVLFLTFRELRRRREAQAALAHAALHDPLTGLPNRSLLADRVEAALARHHAQKGRMAVMFIDLDRFKTINDALGHHAGDVLLQDIATRLTEWKQDDELVARQGGDEFVVLIERAPAFDQVAARAQALLTTLSKPLVVSGKTYPLSASVGIAMFPEHGADADTLLQHADIAMYAAKSSGRNAFRLYNEDMGTSSRTRAETETDLQAAVGNNEFVLHFQPKMDARTGALSGVEALVRWQHPTRGLLGPEQWIHIAENTKLIVPIGRWVLREACARAREWQSAGFAPLSVAVNLSASQFADPRLLEHVKSALEDSGLAPELLELELTESMVMNDADDAVLTLNALKRMRIQLAIDDFGTGYSSLAYLRRFPIDSLKIDQSFVRDIPHNADDCALAKAIIAMAQSLDLKVVAEGVANADQLEFFRSSGCDLVQGYLFSKPLPEAALVEFLQHAAGTPNNVVQLASHKRPPSRT